LIGRNSEDYKPSKVKNHPKIDVIDLCPIINPNMGGSEENMAGYLGKEISKNLIHFLECVFVVVAKTSNDICTGWEKNLSSDQFITICNGYFNP
jgi:hypothetical protein